jgi:hypothetical protein
MKKIEIINNLGEKVLVSEKFAKLWKIIQQHNNDFIKKLKKGEGEDIPIEEFKDDFKDNLVFYKTLIKKQNKEPEESTLNEYHQQRNKEALKEVEEMMKHPVSIEEMRLQAQLLNEFDEVDKLIYIPEILYLLSQMKTPLRKREKLRIKVWLARKQITKKQIPDDILLEYNEFEKIFKRNKD